MGKVGAEKELEKIVEDINQRMGRKVALKIKKNGSLTHLQHRTSEVLGNG